MKPDQCALLLNAPSGYLEKLTPLPEGTEFVTSSAETVDFVLLFVKHMVDLQEWLPRAVQEVKHDALLWIAYPKGSAKTGTYINRDTLWAAVSEQNITGVTLVSLDETWSWALGQLSESKNERSSS